MIKSDGKNDFQNNIFDMYRWSANTYETAHEITEYIGSLNLEDKQVCSVRAIGALYYDCVGNWREKALEVLAKAGIVTLFDIDEKYAIVRNKGKMDFEQLDPVMKSVETERSVNLHEPLIITFDDDSTLELMPGAGKGLRIGYNSLPKDMEDGMNHCEFDIGQIFNPIFEQKKSFKGFVDFVVHENGDESVHSCDRFPGKTRRWNRYVIRCGSFSLILKEIESHEYEFYVTQNQTITCGELGQLQKEDVYQNPIKEGIYGGGATMIYVANGTGYDEQPWEVGNQEDAFSVWWGPPHLVEKLAMECFDPELPPNKEYTRGKYDNYDWNFFTKETMINILNQAEKKLNLITKMSVEDKAKALGWRIENFSKERLYKVVVADIDFTERFIIRLRGMVNHTPGYTYIVFQGP